MSTDVKQSPEAKKLAEALLPILRRNGNITALRFEVNHTSLEYRYAVTKLSDNEEYFIAKCIVPALNADEQFGQWLDSLSKSHIHVSTFKLGDGLQQNSKTMQTTPTQLRGISISNINSDDDMFNDTDETINGFGAYNLTID